MSECYPTGCTPCTSPIEFPEVLLMVTVIVSPLGSNGEQKCWVYDKCIPGWRAEGPNTSPSLSWCCKLMSQVNQLSNEQAGDW